MNTHNRYGYKITSSFLLLSIKDCAPEGDCENYKCIILCKNNQDCQDGEFCAKRRCIPPTCNKDSDCGLGNKCFSKNCIAGCQRKRDCPQDRNCIDDYCFIPPGNHLGDLLLNLA